MCVCACVFLQHLQSSSNFNKLRKSFLKASHELMSCCCWLQTHGLSDVIRVHRWKMFSLVSRSSGFYRRVDSIGDERSTHFRSFINSFLCIFVHTSSCTLRSSHYTILQVNSLQPFFLPLLELFHTKSSQKWTLPRPLKPDSKHFFKLAYSDSDSTGQTYSVLYSWFYNQLLFFKDAHFGFFPANTDNHLPLTVHTIRFLTFSLLLVYEHTEGRKREDVGSKDGFKDS